MLARYWRYRPRKAARSTYRLSFRSIVIFDRGGVDITAQATKTGTVSVNEPTAILDNAFDGNHATWWESEDRNPYDDWTGREYLLMVFPTPVALGSMVMTPYYTWSPPSIVEYSTDGNVWFTIARRDTSGSNTTPYTITIPETFTPVGGHKFWALIPTNIINLIASNFEISDISLRDATDVNLTPNKWSNWATYDSTCLGIAALSDGNPATKVTIAESTHYTTISNLDLNVEYGLNGPSLLRGGVMWGQIRREIAVQEAELAAAPVINPDKLRLDCSTVTSVSRLDGFSLAYCDTTMQHPQTGQYMTLMWNDLVTIDHAESMFGTPLTITDLTTTAPRLAASDNIAPVTTCNSVGGLFTSKQIVSLTADDVEARIYYTLDGSTPTTASTLYTAPIKLTETATLKFFARDVAGNNEIVQSVSFTITLQDILVDTNIPSGQFFNCLQIALLASGIGANIFFTLDGSEPTEESTLYTTPITLGRNTTLKFFGMGEAYTTTSVVTKTYLFKGVHFMALRKARCIYDVNTNTYGDDVNTSQESRLPSAVSISAVPIGTTLALQGRLHASAAWAVLAAYTDQSTPAIYTFSEPSLNFVRTVRTGAGAVIIHTQD